MKKLRAGLLCLGIGMLLAFIGGPLVLYYCGLSFVPELPEPPEKISSLPAQEKAWLLVEKSSSVEYKAMTPWVVYRMFLSGSENYHFVSGESALAYLARQQLGQQTEIFPNWKWHLANFSLAVWLSRNWQPEEAASAIAQIEVSNARQ